MISKYLNKNVSFCMAVVFKKKKNIVEQIFRIKNTNQLIFDCFYLTIPLKIRLHILRQPQKKNFNRHALQ